MKNIQFWENFQQTGQQLKRLVINKDGVPQRKLTGRFQCTQSYINRVIKSMGDTKIQETKDSRHKRSTKGSQ